MQSVVSLNQKREIVIMKSFSLQSSVPMRVACRDKFPSKNHRRRPYLHYCCLRLCYL